MAAVSFAARWRQWVGGVELDGQGAEGRVLLVAMALLLAMLALAGGGRDLIPWTVFVLVVLGLLTIFVATGRVRRIALTYPLAGIAAVVAVTAIWSVRWQSSFEQFVAWIAYIAVFLVTASALSPAGMAAGRSQTQRTEWARRFVDAAVVVGGILVLVGLYWFWGTGNPLMRWYSTFYWPNPFAGFLLLVLPIEILRCLFGPSRREALAHGVLTVLLGTAFVLTFSRGAWLAGAVTAVMALGLLRTSLRREAMVRGAGLLAALLASIFLLTQGQALRSPTAGVITRAASTGDFAEYSIQGRLHFWRAAAEISRDHPLVGTGPGTYGTVSPQYQRDVRFYAQNPHSMVAQMAAETGVVGLAAFVWLMVALVALGVRVIRLARGRPEFPWVTGVAFGVGAFWLHTGMEINWSFPAGPAMAFALMGILAWYDAEFSAHALSVGSPHAVPRWARLVPAAGLVLVMVAVGMQYGAALQFRAGQAAYGANKWQDAAAAFAIASALNPLDPRYPSALAEARLQVGDAPGDVIRLVRRASGLDRNNPGYWVQLALLSRRIPTASSQQDVEAFLRRAISLDPFHYPEAYRYLAAVYRERGDREKALDVYRQAAVRYPDSVAQDFVLRPRLWPGVVALFMDWGTLLSEHRRYSEAEDVYARIVRLEPRFAPAYVALVRVYLVSGRVEEAARMLNIALTNVPDNPALQALRRELQARK